MGYIPLKIKNIKEIRSYYGLPRSLIFGHSLAVQWLGLSAFTAVAQIQSLVGEARSPKATWHSTPHPPHKKSPISMLYWLKDGQILEAVHEDFYFQNNQFE